MSTEKTIGATLGELAAAEAVLQRVLAVKLDKDGGARVRYHLAKLARLVAAETKHFREERDALVAKHGENGQIAPSSSKWAAFVEELGAVGEVPISIAWGPLTASMVEPYAEITAADLVGLGPLFEFGDEAPA